MPIAATNTANNGTLSLTATGYIIPANSYFRIRGNVILTSNPAYIAADGSNCCSENGTYGPGGTAYVNELRVQAQIKYTDNSGTVGVNFPGLGYGPSAPDSAVSAITVGSVVAATGRDSARAQLQGALDVAEARGGTSGRGRWNGGARYHQDAYHSGVLASGEVRKNKSL